MENGTNSFCTFKLGASDSKAICYFFINNQHCKLPKEHSLTMRIQSAFGSTLFLFLQQGCASFQIRAFVPIRSQHAGAAFEDVTKNSGLPSPFAHQSRLYMSTNVPPSSSSQGNGKKKKKRNLRRNKAAKIKPPKNPNAIQTWRIFGVEVDPDSLGEDALIQNRSKKGESSSVEQIYLSQPLLDSLLKRLKIEGSSSFMDGTLSLPPHLKNIRVVRRSLDARKKKVLREGPRYTYVVDIDITAKGAMDSRLRNQPGRNEIMNLHSEPSESDVTAKRLEKKTVIVVGAGPAGLFCALALARSGTVTPILLERGQPVECRGKDIGRLIHRKVMNVESNFAFGEGGAGTWSDGKLTTRIGRNSKNVRSVLETLVKYGAPEKILLEGSPHLGTDNLVRLLRNMRMELREMGGEIHFGAKMASLLDEGGNVTGVNVEYSTTNEKGFKRLTMEGEEKMKTLYGDAVVLATGHSARDVYEDLHKSGVKLEPKGFAAGFRVEHPQKIINKIQYGENWGRNAFSGKGTTDSLNEEFFSSNSDGVGEVHNGRLPVASYRLATDKAFDGAKHRGAYSFCMCPGGQIVPASTQPDEVCVNGMSFSRRDSVWANAALVVTISPEDPILDEYRDKYGVLAGIEFQKEMERKAAIMGGGNFTVPVQRLTDFMNDVASTSAPSSSYRLGIKPSPCHEIYPKPMVKALQDAVKNQFDQQMPGFLCDDALLHAVETRTSSPVRICRDPETMQAIGRTKLYPAGEGAGFAGGIVSAAVDGLVVAEAVLHDFGPSSDEKYSKTIRAEKSVGYEY